MEKLENHGLDGNSKSTLKEELERMKDKKPYSQYTQEEEDEDENSTNSDDDQNSTFKDAKLDEKEEALLLEFFEKGFLTQEAYEAINKNPRKMREIIEMLKKLKISKEQDPQSLKKLLQKNRLISRNS